MQKSQNGIDEKTKMGFENGISENDDGMKVENEISENSIATGSENEILENAETGIEFEISGDDAEAGVEFEILEKRTQNGSGAEISETGNEIHDSENEISKIEILRNENEISETKFEIPETKFEISKNRPSQIEIEISKNAGYKTKIEILGFSDQWQAVKDAAMNTIGKESGKYPNSKWKMKILLAEHSPIRLLKLRIRIENLPYWVSTHFVRHKFGIDHWISTQRSDRTGICRDDRPQGAWVDYVFEANAQALINISRKRLCRQASPETRKVWSAVREAVRAVEPELAACMVPECIYRGKCPEMSCCGYYPTDKWLSDLVEYRQMWP